MDGTDPTDWKDPESPGLTGVGAPHETAAVLRLQRSGWPAARIMKLLGISSHQLIHELKLALDDESFSDHKGLPIHCPTVSKEEW